MPWFDDAGITNIQSPTGWAFAIEEIGVANAATGWNGVAAWQTPGDPFYFGPDSPFTHATHVLHWYNLEWDNEFHETWIDPPLFGPNFQGGFSFDAGFGEVDAPYQASWAFFGIQSGDPPFPGQNNPFGLPNSPSLQSQPVPEPGTLVLLGLVGMVGYARRRRG